MKKKTSLSLDRQVLKLIKLEAERQRRSVSGLFTLWLEEKFEPSAAKDRNGKEAAA